MVNFDQFFNIEGKSPLPKSPELKPQASPFQNFAKAEQPPKPINKKDDFAFFD